MGPIRYDPPEPGPPRPPAPAETWRVSRQQSAPMHRAARRCRQRAPQGSPSGLRSAAASLRPGNAYAVSRSRSTPTSSWTIASSTGWPPSPRATGRVPPRCLPGGVESAHLKGGPEPTVPMRLRLVERDLGKATPPTKSRIAGAADLAAASAALPHEQENAKKRASSRQGCRPTVAPCSHRSSALSSRSTASRPADRRCCRRGVWPGAGPRRAYPCRSSGCTSPGMPCGWSTASPAAASR